MSNSGTVGAIYIQDSSSIGTFVDKAATLQLDNKSLIIDSYDYYGFVNDYSLFTIKKDGNIVTSPCEIHFDRIIFLEAQTAGTYSISGTYANLIEVGGAYEWSIDLKKNVQDCSCWGNDWEIKIKGLNGWAASAKKHYIDDDYISMIGNGTNLIIALYTDYENDNFYLGYGHIDGIKNSIKVDGITDGEISFSGGGTLITSKFIAISKIRLELDRYESELQFVYSLNRLLTSYTGNAIEVRRDSDDTTQEFNYVNDYIDTASILTFVGANNGYIRGYYDQKSGTKTTIATQSQQQQIVNSGAIVTYTNKYLLEIPSTTSLTISGIACTNRSNNLNCLSYIGFKGQKSISGYSGDYVYIIKCSSGLMDFSVTNTNNLFWYDADGNISTATRPAVTLTNAGNTYMFGTNLTVGSCYVQANSTGNKLIGNLKDLPRLINGLSLANCTLVTGSLSDLGGRLLSTLSLYNCPLITGDLSDLGGNLTSYLSLYGCSLVTGSLSDLNGKLVNYLSLFGCSLIIGVYTPSSATTTPTTFTLSNTGLSTSDVDNTLIACRATPKNGVTFTGTGLSRTSASNTVYAELDTTYTWTFVGLS